MKRSAWILFVVLLYVAFEGLAWGASAWISRGGRPRGLPLSTRRVSATHRAVLEDLLAGRTTYLMHSPTLGWTIKPGGARESTYRANRSGFRALAEYSERAPLGTLRIVTVGDSFTHGTDVRNEDTWQEAMMGLRPKLEVLNFGVGAYGPDQALLRYEQDAVRFKPHIVLFGYMSENFLRTVSVYRPFYIPGTVDPLTKPRFVLDGDGLRLLPNPISDLAGYRDLLDHPERVLPRVAEHDYYVRVRPREGQFDFLPSVRTFKAVRYRMISRNYGMRDGVYDVTAEPYRVTTRIFDRFFETARRNGSTPIAVIFPDRGDVAQHRRDGSRGYAPLLAYLREKGYRHIDLMDAFAKDAREMSLNDLVPTHYTPKGHVIVARALLNYLAGQRLTESGTQAVR